jgi:CubicO group peptidase (beta-lactamase class C family)
MKKFSTQGRFFVCCHLMTNPVKFFLILTGIILISSCSNKKTDTNNLADKIDKYIQAKVDFYNFSGAVLVAKNDSIILHKGYGLADREWNVPNSVDTKFRIGSNTKQFTAVCILQLEEEGKLSLNDNLSKYFTGFEYGDTVTIQMLLTHSSGIQDYFGFKGLDFKPVVITKDSMVALLKTKLYNFLPGCDIDYSNSNFFLLGLIVEKVSGESFENYLKRHILNIVGMPNTGIDRYDTILSNRAKGYIVSPYKVTNAFDNNYTWDLMFGCGSMYSTVEDMYKFKRAFSGNSILNEASKNKMFSQYGYAVAQVKKKTDPSNTTPGNMDPFWYHLGYGVSVDTLLDHKRIFTRGYVPGFKSTIYNFYDDKTCIIVLQNNEENPDGIAYPLSEIVFGRDVPLPYKHEPYKINTEILKKYTGKWTGNIYNEKSVVEIVIKDNKFYRRIDGNPDIELIPESQTKFYYADGSDRQFEFVPNNKGEVTRSWYIMSGVKFRRDKIR